MFNNLEKTWEVTNLITLKVAVFIDEEVLIFWCEIRLPDEQKTPSWADAFLEESRIAPLKRGYAPIPTSIQI